MILAFPIYELSPSQLELFDAEDGREGCNLKWAFNYVFNDAKPVSNETAELGKRCHKKLELHLKGERFLSLRASVEDDIVISGIQHFPAPGHGVQAETDFQLQLYNHHFIGTKDAEWYDKGELWVADLKTTKDFKYALTKEELRTGYQGPLYAAESLFRTGEDKVNLRWVYVRTKGPPKSHIVETVFTPRELDKPLDKAKYTADKLLDVRRLARETKDPGSIPGNLEACEAYGGCPHKEYCPARKDSGSRLKSLFARNKVVNKESFVDQVNPMKPKPVKIDGKWVTPPMPKEENEKPETPPPTETAKKKPGRPPKNKETTVIPPTTLPGQIPEVPTKQKLLTLISTLQKVVEELP